MVLSRPYLKHIVTAALVAVAFSLPFQALAQGADGAAAGPDEPAADLTDDSALLAQLAIADADEARRLDRQLQALWAKSGSAAMDLLLERARDAIEAGDTATAIDHLTALTDHAPDFAEGWHARASAYFQADLFGPAVADLERALALNPNNYNAIFGLGSILETFGDRKRAYEAYQRVRALHPHHEAVGEALERLQPQIEGQSL
jgi:tetratricopeptide (TPR) repeat protein